MTFKEMMPDKLGLGSKSGYYCGVCYGSACRNPVVEGATVRECKEKRKAVGV